MNIKSSNIADDFVVISPEKAASLEAFTPTLFQELDERYNGFKGHELVSSFEFDADWSTWEKHPEGDEVVMLLSGAATLVLDLDGDHRSIVLETPGSYVVVPRGIWHTARTNQPTRMLFITPGEGTLNRSTD